MQFDMEFEDTPRIEKMTEAEIERRLKRAWRNGQLDGVDGFMKGWMRSLKLPNGPTESQDRYAKALVRDSLRSCEEYPIDYIECREMALEGADEMVRNYAEF